MRTARPDDAAWVRERLTSSWGSTLVARCGELVDAARLPALVALLDGEHAGLATFEVRGSECELVTLDAFVEDRGIGRALVERCAEEASRAGSRRLWLITTNDNLRAIGFYQRVGLDLCALHHNAVARARELKPSIPLFGAQGIPIRHELEFELRLSARLG